MFTIDTNTRQWRLVFSLLLLLLGGAFYANGMQAPFLFDGIIHILNNPAIRDITDLSRVFASGYQETRPVYMLSLAICYAIAGTDVFVYHLVNLLLHLCSALLVYRLGHALRDDMPSWRRQLTWFPECSALFFLLHPLHTESVTYINSRSGVLMTCFGLLAFWLFLRSQAADATKAKRRLAYLGSLITLLLAMGSKEPAALFPLVMLLYLWGFRRTQMPTWRARLVPLLPHLACIAVVPLLYLLVTNPHPANPLAQAPWHHHLWTQFQLTGYFLLLSIVPFQQNFDYHVPLVTSPWQLSVVASFVGLSALAWLGWRTRKTCPLLGYSLFWFLLFLAPTNSLLLRDFVAERYLYTSVLGASWLMGLAVAWGLAQLAQASSRRILWGLVIVWMGWFGVQTMLRNALLSDPIALWRDTVAQSPHKGRPHLNLGVLLLGQGKHKEGWYHLQQSARWSPQEPDVHYNLGVFEERRSNFLSAAKHFQKAQGLQPTTKYQQALARMYRKEGSLWYGRRQYARAARLFRDAIKASPTHPGAHFNLAMALLRQGKTKEAKKQLRHLLTLTPFHHRGRDLLQQLSAAPTTQPATQPTTTR